MDCKRLEAEIVKKKSYMIESLFKKYFIDDSQIRYNVKQQENSLYTVSENQKQYGVCYCVRYRPIWMLERILARGWWNDKWIWTADWIFNDWII